MNKDFNQRKFKHFWEKYGAKIAIGRIFAVIIIIYAVLIYLPELSIWVSVGVILAIIKILFIEVKLGLPLKVRLVFNSYKLMREPGIPFLVLIGVLLENSIKDTFFPLFVQNFAEFSGPVSLISILILTMVFFRMYSVALDYKNGKIPKR